MSDSPPAKENLGASARRGLLFISAAKLWFMVAGLLMQLLLPRALGSAALFGVWTLVLSWVSALNNVMITATIQGVSHFAAAGPPAVEEAKRTALRMQALVGVGAALLFFLCAPLIADFEHDPELAPQLRLASAVVLCYSFYAVFVGAANGARQFHKQAGLDMTFSTLRVGLVIGAAWVFHGTMAAISGFATAAALITVASILLVGLPRNLGGEPVPLGKMLRFSAWLVLYLGATNVLLFLDGWWLKRLCAESMATLPDAKRAVDAMVGVYGAAQTVARLPYQLCLAGTFVVFPLMSAAALQANAAETRRYVASTLRYALIAAAALVVALASRPDATMRLLYPAEYATGAPALQVLLLAYLGFSLFAIAGTVLNGVGRTVPTTIIGLCTVLVTTLAVYARIRAGLAAGEQPLRPAAQGLALGVGLGLLASLGYIYYAFRATFSPLTLLRVGAACGAALLLGRFWPAAGSPGLLGSKVGTLLSASLAGLVYLAVLAGTGELSLRELRSLRRPPGGKSAGAAAAAG